MESITAQSRSSSINLHNIKKECHDRKRHILYLIMQFLHNHNFHDTAESLSNEAQLTNLYEICDNIDLDLILQEYESYYFIKFQRMPKIIRKVDGELQQQQQQINTKKMQKRNVKINNTDKSKCSSPKNDTELKFEIISLNGRGGNNEKESDARNKVINTKPLCEFEGYTSEWREMAEQVTSEIVKSDLNVTWKDCLGLSHTIEVLKEAVIYPINYPEIFNGLIKPWKGILLYGPPGNGKTLLAKALACESNHTFINVTSSTFTSKWRGESEKLIRVLFDVAKYYAPTIIFVDELDGMASGQEDYQHEASRRFKSELLIQLDGILRKEDQVFILASTNSPWKLDASLVRRFEKRILIDVPDEQCRIDLFRYFLQMNGYEYSNNELKQMAEITSNFTGSDIKLVSKEIVMNTIREKLSEIKRKNNTRKIEPKKPNMNDIVKAIEKTRPTFDANIATKYYDWQKRFGCL